MARRSSFGVALASARLRIATTLIAIVAMLAPSIAFAQSVPPPSTYYSIDGNGVDIVSGAYLGATHSVSVGQPGMGGLIYTRTYDSSAQYWRDNVTGTINFNATSSIYTVTLMDASELFTLSGGVYTSSEGRGGTLTFNSGTNEYTYTTASGVVAIYDKDLASSQPTQANEGRVTQVTMPSGERWIYTYTELRTPALPATPTFLAHRMQSITNNLGYQLSFKYENNDTDDSGINLIQVMAINNAIDYCDPTANGCSLSGWPTLAFGVDGTAITVTDATSRTWRYAITTGRITGIRWPSSSSDDITLAYNFTTGRLSTLTSAAGTWTYGFNPPSGTASVTYPGSSPARSYTITNGRVTNYLNGTFSEAYQYDTQGRLTRVTQQLGNYVAYTYDSRGNITETRQVAKAGSGLSDIVATAAYDTTCSNPVTCNQPNSTTDGRGYRTDYTYNSTHGGVLTITSPAPSGSTPVGSGTRPQTRLSYTQLYAYYRQSSGGGVTAAPTGVYRLTGTSACATSSSCSGGSDETATTITYGSTGVANNRLPLTVSTGAGNGSLTATTSNTYDNVGNVTAVDGPLSGTGDTTQYVYDAARRRLGVIGPDPDSGGSLLNRAIRYNYDGHGWVSSVERGTASGGTWGNFSALETLSVTYDGAGRRIRQSFVAGGATHAVTQYSYNSASLLDCVAVRMNPSVFGSLPSSACSLGTEGTNGPDRITHYTYDSMENVARVTNAYGTSAQQDTLVQTHFNNGLLVTSQDANGNLTTYEYDGFDRLQKIRFPNTSGGGSSTTDYEQYTYDANFNVTQDRRRDGATISYAYDNLNRASTMTPSAGSAVSYSYDNFSRMTQAAFTGHTLTFGYDQLSRNTSAGGPLGTVSYQYDVAGRRTRITWPDSFYAQYDYDLTGAVTAIRENGASSGVGVLATYAYDNLARRTSVTRGNGTTTTYDYDAAGRLEELAQDLASTANDVTFNFTYNASSQAITNDRTTSNSGYVWPQPANSTLNSTANGLNQIAQLAGTNFTYDGRGNLTSTGTATYSYDVYNRLTSAGSATLAYDPGGRLYQTTSNGTTVTARLQYDGVDLIAEYNSSNALLRRYVHGPGTDEPIVWYEGSGTSDRRWLHQDQLGSVIALSNSSGALIGSPNTYDEYGLPGSSNVGRFQYTGQMWLPEASLYHYKARAYLPTLGRFAQSDPVLYWGSLNLYGYVANDPMNFTDPSGACVPACLVILGPPVIAGVVTGSVTAWLQWRDETTDNTPGVNTSSIWGAFAGGFASGFIGGFNVWWGGAIEVGVGEALMEFNRRQDDQKRLNPDWDDRPNGRPYRNPEGPPIADNGDIVVVAMTERERMMWLSTGHRAIYNWSVFSSMSDTAFLIQNGMGAATWRSFTMNETERALARIANMPLTTVRDSLR
ncbi:MAG: hypothetical protein KF779_09050 [Hyphomonadaceae bacterium]|nr:hypothetical protein [Hyphomonadaceae bacterium]